MVSQENTMNVGNNAAGYIPVEADFTFQHTDGELALDDNFAAQSFLLSACTDGGGMV